ncbi:MAG: selenocysteine-specific translation elongation factor [Desulfuromonadaceae bacterium]|nr:selenocysteine-specific translation elongation factor [Desulfuromonadaceae bacterium]
MSPVNHLIIGTAGHVDHGKTELIRALTGIETDRLREEKERGISIELGFALFRLPDGSLAGVVDVPGHERFISTMLAGIGGIDLVLLVIDVNEGVMPQTREHLQILNLLDIERGIIVLTKCDLAEEDWIDIVEEEVREEVAATFLKGAPLLRVSAITGDGIAELKTQIATEAAALAIKDHQGPLRLPIDRHFSVPGFGTVVTGTLLAGTVQVGDTLELLPRGIETRVREVQVHGKKVPAARAGQRAALNLTGVERALLQRGAVAATPGIFEQTERIDVRLTLLANAPRPLKFRDPVHFYLGTAHVVGLVALLDCDELQPGESAVVQIHLDRPLVAHREDRFIIRSYSPMTTIGGGKILDSRPVKHRRFRADVLHALQELESGEKAFLLQKIEQATCCKLKELEQLAGLGRERIQENLQALAAQERIVQLGEQWLTVATHRAWQRRLHDVTAAFHHQQPLLTGIPRATLKSSLPRQLAPKSFDQLLNDLTASGRLCEVNGTIALPDFTPRPTPAQQVQIDRIEQLYREDGMQAKNRQEMLERLGLELAGCDALFGYLFAQGELVRLNAESFLHRDSYAQALNQLRAHFSQHETLTLAEFRDLIGSARKQTQALLEHFDELKYTLRQDDVRVAWQLN